MTPNRFNSFCLLEDQNPERVQKSPDIQKSEGGMSDYEAELISADTFDSLHQTSPDKAALVVLQFLNKEEKQREVPHWSRSINDIVIGRWVLKHYFTQCKFFFYTKPTIVHMVYNM